MKQIIQVMALTLFLFTTGCDGGESEKSYPSDSASAVNQKAIDENPMVNDTNVVRVYVDSVGTITADGTSTDLTKLDSAFSKLKRNKGTVYYSRDQVQGAPPAASAKVIGLVAKYRLAVKFFTDKTFSKDVNSN